MQDTIYYNPDGTQTSFDSLPADVKQLIQQTSAPGNASQNNDGSGGYVIAIIVVYLIAYIIIKLSKLIDGDFAEAFSFLKKENYQNNRRAPFVEPATNTANTANNDNGEQYYIYDGSTLGLSQDEIEAILVKRYPYYTQLWLTIQYRFMQRLLAFMQAKKFIIYSNEPYKEMPVLTSAAAIHLTLGLDDYMLPWYSHIAVHSSAYFAQDSLRILAGNVDGKVITLAWDELLKGINNTTDGSNVGLHEMAHALYYQHAVADENRQVNFSSHFDKVMQEGEEVYKLKDNTQLLYSDSAYRNLQEFWAESVELFFEKPVEMQQCYPEIYDTIKGLLKQDPVIVGNPVMEI